METIKDMFEKLLSMSEERAKFIDVPNHRRIPEIQISLSNDPYGGIRWHGKIESGGFLMWENQHWDNFHSSSFNDLIGQMWHAIYKLEDQLMDLRRAYESE